MSENENKSYDQTIAELTARILALETTASNVPSVGETFSDIQTTLDAINERLNLLETAQVSAQEESAARVAAAPAVSGDIDAAWINHVLQKYFFDERPVAG